MRWLLLAAKTAGLANRRTDILANRISQLFPILLLKLLFFPKVSAMGKVLKAAHSSEITVRSTNKPRSQRSPSQHREHNRDIILTPAARLPSCFQDYSGAALALPCNCGV